MKKNNEYFCLIILILSISLGLLFCYQLEPDYFWHIKAGEYMFHHGILTHDIFSWSVFHQYWMSHEWLFEIILYILRSLFGNIHVLIYTGFLSSILLIICFLPNWKNVSKNLYYGLFYLLFFFMIFAPFIQARPHMISFVLFALSVWFLYDYYQNKESHKIWFLPLLSIIWANVHGGSSNLPYLLCFLFGISGMFSFQMKKIEAKRITKKQIKTYFIIMFLCMIAVCINPHFFRMFLYPYQNMMDTTMLQNIREWQGTSLNVFYHYIYYAFLLFMIGTFLFSSKKIQFVDLFLFAFSAYLGLKSIRFWIFGPVIMSFIIFPYVCSKKMVSAKVVVSTLGVFVGLIFLFQFKNYLPIVYRFYLTEDIYTVLEKEKPNRLFNMYDFGGELVYHDIPVFIDGRADLYSSHNYRDYLDISYLKNNAPSLMQKYDFDYYLVSDEYPIYTYLHSQDEYKDIYHHEHIWLYKKNSNS